MRILFMISSIGIGGEQRVASIITNYLVNEGNDVDIACFKRFPKSFKFNDNICIKVIEKKGKTPKNLHRLMAIRKQIKLKSYDIIIGFGVIPSVIASLANVGLHHPVIVCERNDPDVYPCLWKIIRSVAYNFAHGAIFQTKEASSYFKNELFKRRIVIPNPLELDKIPDNAEKIRKKVIVNTSRLVPAKNHRMLIEAYSRISNEFPEYRIEIYGDGELKDSLINLINRKKLSQRVKIFESVPNVLDKIKDSEIFVLTSNNEGFPNSLAEAMAMGIACISTDCRIGGPKDMIENNQNGLLINVNDINNLEKTLKKLINDNHLREQISKEAYQIRYRLDSEKICAMWIDFLNSFIVSANPNSKNW